MHIYILEYCFPKLLNESPDGQMVFFLPVQLPEFCYIFCRHLLLHQPTPLLACLYQALHILTFCFLCSFPASMLQCLLEPENLAYQRFVLSNHNLAMDIYLATVCSSLIGFLAPALQWQIQPLAFYHLSFPHFSLQMTTFSISSVRCELTIYILSTSCISFIIPL